MGFPLFEYERYPDYPEIGKAIGLDGGYKAVYKADGKEYGKTGTGKYSGKWRPSIHMPRWASRIQLEVTEVRVQRLQEINSDRHDDVLQEGYPFGYDVSTLNENPVTTFSRLWDSINSKRGYSWESNPWVWSISFKRIPPPEREE